MDHLRFPPKHLHKAGIASVHEQQIRKRAYELYGTKWRLRNCCAGRSRDHVEDDSLSKVGAQRRTVQTTETRSVKVKDLMTSYVLELT